ncbi:hypothetical protein [Caballeronia sp. AZ10_KS36]|uniref:hypothetical protein n=1 Tax=Caballeronia sp. AZ10_KS36 TaxID=2921757 RepID=UPI002028E29C|nr:hypothetical protein [Caballeronia sp. AZ10_KS36]
MEAVVKKHPNRAQLVALIGAAALCFAAAASAESQAVKKLGQITVINQTLQPKPLKANPVTPLTPTNNYTNAPNAAAQNPSVGSNYSLAPTYNWNAIKAANAANAANAARANAIPGAPSPAAKK